MGCWRRGHVGWDSSTSHSIIELEEPKDGGSHCRTDSFQGSFVGTGSRGRFWGSADPISTLGKKY